MKTILMIALSTVSTVAVAQKKVSLSKSVDDNGKTLSISINGTIDGKAVRYENIFDVSAMNKTERTALQKRIMDSLDLSIESSVATAPTPPQPPAAPSVTAETSIEKAIPGETEVETEQSRSGDVEDYYKRISWSPKTGKLVMKYRFQNKVYEETVELPGSDSEKRAATVKAFELKIGFPPARRKQAESI
ncbi:MAG: hypothetical protein QM731_05845 [Chitinophagaceae bacterium]